MRKLKEKINNYYNTKRSVIMNKRGKKFAKIQKQRSLERLQNNNSLQPDTINNKFKEYSNIYTNDIYDSINIENSINLEDSEYNINSKQSSIRSNKSIMSIQSDNDNN